MPRTFVRAPLAAALVLCAAVPAFAARWEVHTNANDLVTVSAIGGSVYAGSLFGLHRYDLATQSFERFFREPGGLLSNAVRAIEPDASGTLWIGTANAGVSLLTTSGRWIAITDFDGLPSDTVTALAPQAGGMWVGTNAGLAFFLGDELLGAWPDGVTPSPFTNNAVVALAAAGGSAWVATASALYVTDDGGLTWRTATVGLDSPRVRALAHDGTALWAATETGAVYATDIEGAWGPRSAGLDRPVRALAARAGEVFAATPGGVFRWDADTSAWTPLGGPENAVLDVAADGTLWAGNFAGLWRSTSTGWIRLRSVGPSGNWITGMALQGSTLYVATVFDGASRFDEARGWRHFLAGADPDTSLITSNFLFLSMVDREGYKWFGDWGGSLARLDDRGEVPSFTHFFNADTMLFTIGWAGAHDADGPVWIGLDTPSRGSIVAQGIVRIDRDGTRVNLQPINAPGMSGQQVRFLDFAPNGQMWVGYADGGVDVFPDSTLALQTRIAHLSVAEGLLNNNVWGLAFFGTDAYIAADGAVSRYRVTAGAPEFVERYLTQTMSPNGAVHPLAVDAAGGLWLATASGLWHRAADGSTESFTVDNSPLVSNDVHSVIVDRTTGDVWIGTLEGLNRLQPGATDEAPIIGGVSMRVLPNPVRSSVAGLVLSIRSPAGDPLVRTDVDVMDLSGRRLTRLRTDGDGVLRWNGDTADGYRLRAGVYLLRALQLDAAGVSRTLFTGRIVLLP